MEEIGCYKILKQIASGGMGEVFLAYDPLCDRRVALKKIRADLLKFSVMKERFIREAKIAAQLSHPSIIPIYTIHEEEGQIYYTMPFVEGQSLKEILKETRLAEKEGESPPQPALSIPSLMRIFLSICQAVHYTHSKGFLHRDLKPDNILIGKYGEVLIIDWGLAQPIGKPDEEGEAVPESESSDLTKPGKVVGTISYMAPERAYGGPSTIQTDIYSLGVMLYLLVALELPFKRKSLEDFRKNLDKEAWVEPSQITPFRDIPKKLSDIARKCLEINENDRYPSLEPLIQDLESYIEGKPEWERIATLAIDRPEDWEFQEHVLLTKQIAITRSIELMQWVMLMISKSSFSGNTRLETDLSLNADSAGIGFLLSISEPAERSGLEDGYSLWIGSEKNPGIRLNRSNTEVAFTPDVALESGKVYHIAIEKVDHHLYLFIDERLTLSYTSQLPLVGTHVGLLYADAEFEVGELKIFTGSTSLMINCLSIPDAFFASKEFDKAKKEYGRIAHSFKGRAEGREALFRQGLCLIEESKRSSLPDPLLQEAYDVFGELCQTPGAPLEYLGKSLIAKEQKDVEEEIKYLEIALRKFPKHPLRPLLIEHIHFRLHESSQCDRNTTYEFLLLALRGLPHLFSREETSILFENLKSNLEPLPFLDRNSSVHQRAGYAIELAFWLKKPNIILDLLYHTIPLSPHKEVLIENAHYALIRMGESATIEKALDLFPEMRHICDPLLLLPPDFSLLGKTLEPSVRTLLLDRGLTFHNVEKILPYFDKEEVTPQSIWAHLLIEDWRFCRNAFASLPKEVLKSPLSPYYPLFGCYLAATKGEEAALSHFNNLIDPRHPPLSALLGHSLRGGTFKTALPFEREILSRHLALFTHCLGDPKRALQHEKDAFDFCPFLC